jgi:hypothetical protein
MNIPSWVPDWTTNIAEGISFGERRCNALGKALEGSGTEYIRTSADPGTILVTGGVIDSIVDLGPPFPKTTASSIFQIVTVGLESLQACLNSHAESWDFIHNSNSMRYQSIAERRNAFAHLILLQTQYHPATEKKFNHYFGFLETLRTYSGNPRVVKLEDAGRGIFSFVRGITQYPQNRRVGVTSQGYIGLVPAIAEKGDVLCAIAGSKLLYVIRQQREAYELIGVLSFTK